MPSKQRCLGLPLGLIVAVCRVSLISATCLWDLGSCPGCFPHLWGSSESSSLYDWEVSVDLTCALPLPGLWKLLPTPLFLRAPVTPQVALQEWYWMRAMG